MTQTEQLAWIWSVLIVALLFILAMLKEIRTNRRKLQDLKEMTGVIGQIVDEMEEEKRLHEFLRRNFGINW